MTPKKAAQSADNSGGIWTNHQWNPQKDVAHRFSGAYVLGMFNEIPAALPAHHTNTAATPPTRKPRVRRKRAPEPKRGQLLVLPSARTGEGKRLREFRAGLIAHVGGSPSFTEAVLIDRCTVLQHHLTTMDRKAEAAGGLSEHDRKAYLAWQNTLTRTLLALGPLAAARQPSPAEALARARALLHPKATA